MQYPISFIEAVDDFLLFVVFQNINQTFILENLLKGLLVNVSSYCAVLLLDYGLDRRCLPTTLVHVKGQILLFFCNNFCWMLSDFIYANFASFC